MVRLHLSDVGLLAACLSFSCLALHVEFLMIALHVPYNLFSFILV